MMTRGEVLTKYALDANLRSTDLRGADLRGADLRGADLHSANLRSTDLRSTDLRSTDLHSADLRSANLYGADLRGADLRGADLRDADLRGADLHGTYLPSPTVILLARWGEVSESLCADLMAYDAASHPNPKLFEEWAKGGPCPYGGEVRVQRAASFFQCPEAWGKGTGNLRPYDLMLRLFKEKGTKF